jgi:hypothetical protein
MFADGQIKRVTPYHTQSFCYLLEIQLPQERTDIALTVFKNQGEPLTEQEPSSILQFHFCSELLKFLPQEIAHDFLQT